MSATTQRLRHEQIEGYRILIAKVQERQRLEAAKRKPDAKRLARYTRQMDYYAKQIDTIEAQLSGDAL